jgi:ketosteroid isomerase-like protein
VSESDRAAKIRSAYEAYSHGDFEPVLDLLDPDVDWHPPPNSLDPQPLRGREAVREYLAPNLFDEQRAEPQEMLEQGDRILVVARTKIRGTASGVEIEETSFHVWTVVDERAVRFEVYTDRDQALAAMSNDSSGTT